MNILNKSKVTNNAVQQRHICRGMHQNLNYINFEPNKSTCEISLSSVQYISNGREIESNE